MTRKQISAQREQQHSTHSIGVVPDDQRRRRADDEKRQLEQPAQLDILLFFIHPELLRYGAHVRPDEVLIGVQEQRSGRDQPDNAVALPSLASRKSTPLKTHGR